MSNIALILPIIGGIFMSISSLCLKKATEKDVIPNTFLICKSITIVLAIIIASTPSFSIEGSVLPISGGLIAGILSTLSMVMWGKSAAVANPSLVSSFFTMASVISPIITTLIIPIEDSTVKYSLSKFMGLLICLFSLSYTYKTNKKIKTNSWIKFALTGLTACIAIEVILFILGLRMTGINSGIKFIDRFYAIESPKWYLIGLCFSSTILQLILKKGKIKISDSEVVKLGFFSAICDMLLSFFTVTAIYNVETSKTPIIFSLVAAGNILGCSAWGNIIYKEKSLLINHTIFFVGLICCSLG